MLNLRKTYSHHNPSISIEIERITKIYIQLEREQGVIDALFNSARSDENIIKNLAKELDLDLMDQIYITVKMYLPPSETMSDFDFF